MARSSSARVLVAPGVSDAPLERSGVEVVTPRRKDELVELALKQVFDAVVLGPLQKTGSAWLTSLVRRLREQGRETPIVCVMDQADAKAKARAAELGLIVCSLASLASTLEPYFWKRAGRRHARVSPLRNRRGERVELASVSATEAKNEFARVLETAIEKGGVAITRHEAPKAVLLSIDEYNALVGARPDELDDLTSDFDALLAKMQTLEARQGVRRAFEASPEELAKAAVGAAQKRG